MKKLYYLILFVLVGITSNAQIVNIPDANFKGKLLAADTDNEIAGGAKIDENDDGEISFAEASSIYTLNINNSNISDLEGIGAFINLSWLDCYSNNLSSLDVSGNLYLNYIHCGYNQLTSLDLSQNEYLYDVICTSNQLSYVNFSQNLQLQGIQCSNNYITALDVTQNQNLTDLWCDNNQLSTIDLSQNLLLSTLVISSNQITTIDVTNLEFLNGLTCSNNLLTSVNVSQNLNLKDLRIDDNQLTTLDVSQNTLLEVLICEENQLSTLDVTQNPNLNVIFCSFNQLTMLDVTQCENLYELSCVNNQITTLDLTQNPFLNSLFCNNNLLLSLFIKNNNQQNNFVLSFSNNPNLEYVCADEDDIPLVQQRITSYGYTNCHVNSYCSFVPNGTFYTIQGNTKFDSNTNGCDASDSNMPNQKFTFTSTGGLSGNLIPDESGDYVNYVQSGTHTITPVLENPNYFTISPTSASVTFPATTSPFTQDFCITANGIKNDVEVTVVPINPARPGFDANYRIIYKNKGNQVANGMLNFSFDDAVMDLVLALPANTSSATNSLTWNYTALNPFETRAIDLILNINSPTETPAVNDGDVLSFTATIVGATDEMPDDNTMTLSQTVVNSYDPNDKTCLEGNTITPSMVGQYVHYVIRFENTGTFPAENVVVTDMIDATKFDVSTLIPQTSSHSFVTRINNGKVEFIFENINLPFDDATNDGYIAFKIKTKPTLVLGDTFTNNASIYFDYNFPIITNTTATTVTALSTQDFEFNTYFTIYPNPAKQTLNINTKNEIGVKSVAIYNTLGQVVLAFTNAETLSSLDVSQLKTGAYFIKLTTDKGTASQQFLKE